MLSRCCIPPAGQRIAYEMDLLCVEFQSPLYKMQQSPPVYGSKWANGGLLTGGLSEIFHHTPCKKQAWEWARTCKHKDKSGSATLLSDMGNFHGKISGSVTERLLTHSSQIKHQKHSQLSQVLVKIALKEINKIYYLYRYYIFRC